MGLSLVRKQLDFMDTLIVVISFMVLAQMGRTLSCLTSISNYCTLSTDAQSIQDTIWLVLRS